MIIRGFASDNYMSQGMLNALHYDWQLNRSHRIYLEKLVFSADIQVFVLAQCGYKVGYWQ